MKLANIDAVREYRVNGPKTVDLGRGMHLTCLAHFFKAGQRLGPARRVTDTLFYIVRGRARVRIADQEEDGRPGDLFLAGGTEEFSIGNSGRDEMILLAVAATPPPGSQDP